MAVNKNRTLASSALILIAIALLVPIYFVPIWWVSLEAPNYPEEAFPDGVRINFHVNGVFSGCQMVEKTEIEEDEALDCVHEMDTINHYVGMYPIASGGPVELFFSLFLLSLVGVMLLGFLCRRPMLRTGVMAIGFALVAVWMAMAWHGAGGLKYHSAEYLSGRITVLGESAEDKEEPELSAGEALIARLKASLAESEVESAEEAPTDEAELSEKAQSIAYLEDAFLAYQDRRDGEHAQWRGSGSQLLAWHYEKSLGRYFRDPAKLEPMVAKMAKAGQITFWGILVIMALLLAATRKTYGLAHRLLGLLPMSLPLLFIIEYAAWLWWYGHNMSEMGAFTLKPFMPTVFGQGKVAQFTTNSYPHVGFWLMLLFAVLLGAAMLLRRRQSQEEGI